MVGLGRAGSLVAQRAHAFGMELIGFDPFVSHERARAMGVRLVGIEELVAEADFVSIHTPKTPETIGLFGRDLLAKAKPGIRIVNTARGGIVDEEALADAIRDGIVAGAGLDVFAKEPCTESPLFELPQVVVSPHLGASTEEAQDKAGVTIAEQVLLALAGDFVPYAVNVAARDVTDTVRGFMGLAEQLGRFFVGLHDGLPDAIDMEYQGELAGESTGILTLSVLKGIFGGSTEEPVSYVNVPQLAEQRGLQVRESNTATSRDYKSLITLARARTRWPARSSPVGLRTEPRIVMVDEHGIEVPPAQHMLVVRNDDRPGVIGSSGRRSGGASASRPWPSARAPVLDGDDGDHDDDTGARPRWSNSCGATDRPRDPPRHAVVAGRLRTAASAARAASVEAPDHGLVPVQLPAAAPVEQDRRAARQGPDDEGGRARGSTRAGASDHA